MIIWATGAESGNFNDFDYINKDDTTSARWINDAVYSWIFSNVKHSGNYSFIVPNYGTILGELGKELAVDNTLKEIYMVFWYYTTATEVSQAHQNQAFVLFTNETFSKSFYWGTPNEVDNTNKRFGLFRADSGTPLAWGTSIIRNAWQCIELHLKVDVNGCFEMKQNGVMTAAYYGDTSYSGFSIRKVFFRGGYFYSGKGYYDDVIIADTNGTSDNSWLGIYKQVLLLKPRADSLINNEFSGTQTAKYGCINKVGTAYFSNTDYITTTTINHKQTFKCDLLVRPGDKTRKAIVKAIILKMDIKKYKLTNLSDYCFVIDNIGSQEYSTPVVIPNCNNHYCQIVYANPFNSNKYFTFEEINSYEYGIKVI